MTENTIGYLDYYTIYLFWYLETLVHGEVTVLLNKRKPLHAPRTKPSLARPTTVIKLGLRPHFPIPPQPADSYTKPYANRYSGFVCFRKIANIHHLLKMCIDDEKLKKAAFVKKYRQA